MGCSTSSPLGLHEEVEDPALRPRKTVPQFHANYVLADKLGKGAFAQVYAAKDVRKPSDVVAVKVIDLRSRDRDDDQVCPKMRRAAANELEILRRVSGQRCCIGIIESFLEAHLCYIVMARCELNLLQALERLPELNERSLGRFLREMLEALSSIHTLRIVHRDVKPDNFLCTGPDTTVKLCDFNLSEFVPRDELPLKGIYGTAPFMSPEMLAAQGYGLKTDVWSFGVLAFVLLLGRFPYQPADSGGKAMKAAILNNTPEPSFELRAHLRAGGADLSAEGREFVTMLLSRDPVTRPSADEALKHKWFTVPEEGLRSHLPVLRAAKKTGAFEGRGVEEDSKRPLSIFLAAQQAAFHGSADCGSDGCLAAKATSQCEARNSGHQLDGRCEAMQNTPTASTISPSSSLTMAASKASALSTSSR